MEDNYLKKAKKVGDLVEDGGAIIGDNDIAICSRQHLVHTSRTQARAYSVRNSLGSQNIGIANVILSLCIYVLLCVAARFHHIRTWHGLHFPLSSRSKQHPNLNLATTSTSPFLRTNQVLFCHNLKESVPANEARAKNTKTYISCFSVLGSSDLEFARKQKPPATKRKEETELF
jgi:hypothetical protein